MRNTKFEHIFYGVQCETVEFIGNQQFISILYLLRLRSDGSRLEELLDIIAAMEKSVAFFEAAAAAAASAAATAAEADAFLVLQWFCAPNNMTVAQNTHLIGRFFFFLSEMIFAKILNKIDCHQHSTLNSIHS